MSRSLNPIWPVMIGFLFCVTSARSAAPSLTFDAPHGGEVYALGQIQKVRLGAKTRAKVVTLELSRDGGTTFELLGAIDNTVKDRALRNMLSFTIAGPASSNCVVRAKATVKKSEVVTLSSPFSIGSAGAPSAGSVTSSSLADGGVTNLKLADGSVTNPKLAGGAVSTDKMTSGAASANFVLVADGSGGMSFTTPQAAGSVTTSAGNSIVAAINDPATASKIGASVLTGTGAINITGNAATATLASNVADAAVSTAKIADNAVTTIKLADASTTTAKLSDGAVTGVKIVDGAVSNAKLSNPSITVTAGTGLSGGGVVSLGSLTTLTLADTSVAAGSYTRASLTVDQQGRLTAASSGPAIGTADLADSAVSVAKVEPFPKSHVSNSTLFSVSDSVQTMLTFDTEEFDTDNCHDNTTNPSRLTCNTAGVYFISVYAAFTANSTGFRHVFVRRNGGAAIASDVRQAFNSSDVTVSTIFQLNAGDFIEVIANQSSGAALNVNARGFMMARLP